MPGKLWVSCRDIESRRWSRSGRRSLKVKGNKFWFHFLDLLDNYPCHDYSYYILSGLRPIMAIGIGSGSSSQPLSTVADLHRRYFGSQIHGSAKAVTRYSHSERRCILLSASGLMGIDSISEMDPNTKTFTVTTKIGKRHRLIYACFEFWITGIKCQSMVHNTV